MAARSASRWRAGCFAPHQIAGHASPKTTKLYDRTADTVTVEEIERIVIWAWTGPRMTPGGLYGHDNAATWVWSDLHLGYTKTIEVFRRPFGTADEMNDTIM